jgi:hypothetical protein
MTRTWTRRLVTGLMAAALVVAGLDGGPGNIDAAATVKIIRLNFDAPGTDNRASNTSLNAEYVTVKNVSTKPVALKGWRLVDLQAHVFTFPALTLAAGASVRVHSGSGTNSTTNLYWRNGNFVWNNDTDTATLKNASAVKIHACHYPNKAGGVVIGGTTATGKYATCP